MEYSLRWPTSPGIAATYGASLKWPNTKHGALGDAGEHGIHEGSEVSVVESNVDETTWPLGGGEELTLR